VSGWTGGGENNLAFKCTRKRFVIETHHLDVEGGVGERRTTPAGKMGGGGDEEISRKKVVVAGRAATGVELEEEGKGDMEAAGAGAAERKGGRGKKVTFWGERGGGQLEW